MNRMFWNGLEESGQPAAGGVYFYRFQDRGDEPRGRGKIMLSR